jgi:hypothetical protein
LLCFALGAEASVWSTVTSDEKMRIEVDLASFMRQSGIVTAWDREIYSAAEQARPGDFYFKSSKSLVRYGCDSRLTELVMKVYYAEDGSEIKVVSAENYGRPNYVIPDTDGERKFEFVCNYKTVEKVKPVVIAKKKAKPKGPDKVAVAKAAEDCLPVVKPRPTGRAIPRYLPLPKRN